MGRIFSFGMIYILLASPIFLFSQDHIIARMIVDAGDFERINTPISFSLEGLNVKQDSDLRLEEIIDKQHFNIPIQYEKDNPSNILWILSGRTAKGSQRVFELYSALAEKNNKVKVTIDENRIILSVVNKKVIQYNSVPVPLPEGVDSVYTRGAFIHPLWSPSGKILTRIQPEDHYHHVGIWNPWTKTHFEGREVDFWNLNKKQGTVRYKAVRSISEGSVYGEFKALHEHIDFTSPDKEKVAMNEEWNVRVYNAGDNQQIRMIDFVSTLSCASDSPIMLDQYRYGGGIGFRATESWNKDNCDVLTSEGKTRIDGDATRARWCNVYGKTDGLTSGILFLCKPENFNFPQPMRIWPIDSNNGNGDMYFQFCPIRDEDWYLEVNQDYFQQYRLLVYDGEISKEMAEQFWLDYVNPPIVRIEKIY